MNKYPLTNLKYQCHQPLPHPTPKNNNTTQHAYTNTHTTPDARGQFTYWSQRTMGRPVNCGIRLDYFVCSNNMFGSVSDDDSKDSAGPQSESNPTGPLCEGVSTTAPVSSSRSSSSSSDTAVVAVEGGVSDSAEANAGTARRTPVANIPRPGVFDCYSLPTETTGCSDHCPIVLVLQM